MGEIELFEIGTIAAAVDHDEILRLADGRQHAVPEIARIVHALAGLGQEGMRLAGAIFAVVADNDDEMDAATAG